MPNTEAPDHFLMALGAIFLLGLATSFLSRTTPLPRATLLLLLGIAIGPYGLDVIPSVLTDRFNVIADVTLLMVGFLIGGKLTRSSLQQDARALLCISAFGALVTMTLVTLGLYWVGVSLPVALILGAIASATAPTAILDVVNEQGKSRFGQLLLSVVAIDDVWALLLFGFALAMAGSLHSGVFDAQSLLTASSELGGATLLGIIIGYPAAYLTGRIRDGQPMLMEALGLVFLAGGVAMWLEVSYLITVMVMGAMITNLAKHHDYPFHAIEGIESLFMMVFFVVAGATMDLAALQNLGVIGAAFVVCRAVGKYSGAYLGGRCGRVQAGYRHWIGLAMLPQAGVPIGMALVASHELPEYRDLLLTLVVSTTVLFEITGPLITRLAVRRTAHLDRSNNGTQVRSDRNN